MKSKAKGIKQAETKVDPSRRPVDGRPAGGKPGNRDGPIHGRIRPTQNHPSSNSSRPTQSSRNKGGLNASQDNFKQGVPQRQSKGPNNRRVTAAASSQHSSEEGGGGGGRAGVERSKGVSQRNGPQRTLRRKPNPEAASR